MSNSDFQFPNQFVQLYCHGIQLRCDDLHEILQTANVSIRRRLHNDCVDFYEMKIMDQTIVSQFDNYHLLMFKSTPPEASLKSFAATLSQASNVQEAIVRLSDYLRATENQVQLKLQHKGEKTEISLHIDRNQIDIDAEAIQFLMVLRLFKIIRIISQFAASTIPVYAIKVMGELNELSKPYIKLHQPEFTYHRQKRNSFVIPTRCLTVKCKDKQTDHSGFLRQQADVLLPWLAGSKQVEEHQTEPQNSLTSQEIREKTINEKTVNLMMNSSLPASELRRRLGLADSASFSLSFKEMNKVKPGEFCNGKMVRLN